MARHWRHDNCFLTMGCHHSNCGICKRNWVTPVMDRTKLILENISARARTKRQSLQWKCSVCNIMRPRLVGLHDALIQTGAAQVFNEQQRTWRKKAGIGQKAFGRRLTKCVKNWMQFRESGRHSGKSVRSGIPRVALVGYTNAEKSTIMNMCLSEICGRYGKQVFVKICCCHA